MKLVNNGLIDGNRCLEEISDEVKVMLIRLGSHSLDYTHRLVKDMACYILNESKRIAMLKFDDKSTEIPPTHEWIADLEIVNFQCCSIKEIPEGMSPYCPRLSTLIINSVEISHVPESFFEYMNSLTILDLSYNGSLESLPNSITKLRYLVSLVLIDCYSLKHVPPLGELQTLSRLVITKSSIEEALQGLDQLLNLIWLDLSHNKSLNLDLGSLSNLTKMQYLDLRDTRVVIRVEDIQGMNNKLERLGGIFDIKDYHNYVQKMPELKMYDLIFRNVCGESRRYNRKYNDLQEFIAGGESIRVRTIQFEDCENISCTLPKDLTDLGICGKLANKNLCDALSYNTSSSSSLYAIDIEICQQLQSLFCLLTSCSFCTKIKWQLQVLVLNRLESLTGFYKEVGVGGQSLSLWGIFNHLVSLNISNCNSIETLLTPSLVQQLHNLERLFVSSCDSMKEIFAVSNNDENETSFIELPKLIYLQLFDLPQLKIMCKRSIHCGSSQPRLSIQYCDDLERYPRVKLVDCEIPYFEIFTTDISPQLLLLELLETAVNLQ